MKLLTIDPKIFEDEEDYFPLYQGLRPSQMGLLPFAQNKKHFLFGPSFSEFRKNKEMCRRERLSKYYRRTSKEYPEIVSFIIETLSSEYPEHFKLETIDDNIYLHCYLTKEVLVFDQSSNLISYKSDFEFQDAFDALSMQVPEDMVIHDFGKGGRDFASYIHLCACNGWSAEQNIGRSFDFIHAGVNRIKQIIPNTIKMMIFISTKLVTFERIAAISFKPSYILNRHPDFEHIYNTGFDKSNPAMNIRVERQTVKGFRKSNAFLFTIRTFMYNANDTKNDRIEKTKEVFTNPPIKSYAYEVIMRYRDDVLRWLNAGG